MLRLLAKFCQWHAESHCDAAWSVADRCEDARHDTGPKGFHDALTCRYCNFMAAYHIWRRNKWWRRYDRIAA